MRRPDRRHIRGQSATELIITLVLVGLAGIIAYSFYGGSVGRTFRCAALKIGSLGGFSEACPSDEAAAPKAGTTVAVPKAPEALPELPAGPVGAPGAAGGGGGTGGGASGGGAGGDGGGVGSRSLGGGGGSGGGAGGATGGGNANVAGGGAGEGGGGTPGSSAARPAPSGGGAAGGDATTGSPPTPRQKLSDAKDLLKTTQKGRDILKYLDDKGIKLDLKSGDGSEYSSGTITIESEESAQEMALTIAHEFNHAQFDKEGKSAKIDTDTRADYVRKMIEEEAIGTVGSIEMKRDLVAAGKTITATFPLEREYNAAYKKAVDDLKKSKPSATADELDKAGKTAGLDAVRDGFNTGKVVAGNTTPAVTYPDYYGKDYDDYHAAKARAARPEPAEALVGTAQQRLDEAKALLGKTEAGADALRWWRGVRRDNGGPGSSIAAQEIKIALVPGTGAIYDRSQRTLFVGDAQSAQAMALSLIQSMPYTVVDHSPLDDTRGNYVDLNVENAIDGAVKAIEVKRALVAQGIKVTEAVPFEAEYDLAYKVTYAKELPHDVEHAYRPGMRARDIYVGPDAKSLATTAGQTAARDAFKSGKPLNGKSRQEYVDYFGKRWDEVRAEQARLDKERAERNRIENEARAKRDAGIQALADVINKVDPNSPDADKVIRLLDALMPSLSGAEQVVLTGKADKGLERLLGPFGYRTVFGSGIGGLQRDRLEYSLGVYATLKEKDRQAIRRDPTGFTAERRGIQIRATQAELEAEGRLVYAQELSDGSYFVGTKSQRADAEERIRIQHALAQLEGIANAGPGALVGRIIGCVAEGAGAYDPCGEKGAAIGGLVDTGLQVYGVVKARQNVKAQINNMTSGGHVVTGGPGGAGFEPASGRLPTIERVPRPDTQKQPDIAKNTTQPNAPPVRPQRPSQQQPQQQQSGPKPPAQGNNGNPQSQGRQQPAQQQNASQSAPVRPRSQTLPGTGVNPPRAPAVEFQDLSEGQTTALKEFNAGKRGAGAKNYDITNKSAKQIDQELTAAGWKKTVEEIKTNGKTGEPLPVEDQYTMVFYEHPTDGSVVRLKPEGMKKSPFAHMTQPHAAKYVKIDPKGGTDFKNEAFKVDGPNAIPKVPDQVKLPAGITPKSPQAEEYLKKVWVTPAHVPLQPNLNVLQKKYDLTPRPDTGQQIKFGQRGVSPDFSSKGRFQGASIDEIAGKLKTKELTPDDLPVQFIWVNGEKVVVNNRSLTTLTKAGFKPTKMEDMTGRLPKDGPDSLESVLERLEEMGGKPSNSIPIRGTDDRNSPAREVVTLPK